MNQIDRNRWIATPLYAAWVVLAMPTTAAAHEGHDEGKPAAATTAATTPMDAHESTPPARSAPSGSARFAATSEQFELVGVLEGRALTLYLDRFADNAPVRDAQIEIEIGTEKLAAKAVGDVYTAELSASPAAGTMPVTATVIVTGGATDLLAADLEVPARQGSAQQSPEPAARTGPFGAVTGAALAAAVAAGAIGWTVGRRRSQA